MKNCINLVLFLLLLLVGCSPERAFTISDKTINIKASEKFVIELDEDHSNGENWMLSEHFNPEHIQYNKSAFTKSDDKGKGKVRFYFEALSITNIILHFKLIRFKDSVDTHQINLIIR